MVNGITFSEFNTNSVLPKDLPTATNGGLVEMGMKSHQTGGKKRRFSKKNKGYGKKKGGKSRKCRTCRASRSRRSLG